MQRQGDSWEPWQGPRQEPVAARTRVAASREGEKWLDSGYSLKDESIGLVDGL